MTIDKEPAELQQLIHILHHGVGLQDTSVKGTLAIIGGKLTGDIPLGSEAPAFAMRKRLILMGLQSKRISEASDAISLLIVAIIFALMIWASYPDTPWWVMMLTSVCLYWAYTSIKTFRRLGRIIYAVKSTEQLIPDPKLNIQPQRVQDIKKLRQRFGKSRMLSRVMGLGIAILAFWMIQLFYTQAPTDLLSLYFIFPTVLMFGIGLIFYPVNKAENLYLYGVTQMSFKDMPAGLKFFLYLGVGLSVAMLVAYGFSVDVLGYLSPLLKGHY